MYGIRRSEVHLFVGKIFLACPHSHSLLPVRTTRIAQVKIQMYVVVRLLARKEDQHLESVFGEEYGRYKESMPAVLPYGLLRRM